MHACGFSSLNTGHFIIQPLAGATVKCPHIEGGYDLPNKDEFLNRAHLLKLLRIEQEITEGIPEGKKENEYFLINNTANLLRRNNNQNSQFWDDCGPWKGGPSNVNLFICSDNNATTEVRIKRHCTARYVMNGRMEEDEEYSHR